MKGKLQLLSTFFYFAWASTQTRLLPLEAPTSNYTSTNLCLFSGNNQRDATTPQRTSVLPCSTLPPRELFELQNESNPCNPSLSMTRLYKSALQIFITYVIFSISVHFYLFIIKTKHIQNSSRQSLYHSCILSHLDPFIFFCTYLQLFSSILHTLQLLISIHHRVQLFNSFLQCAQSLIF